MPWRHIDHQAVDLASFHGLQAVCDQAMVIGGNVAARGKGCELNE
jgi:hypothetical protein